MSQLARECKIHFITFRYKTIYEEVIKLFIISNSQITKAHDYLLYSRYNVNIFNSSLIKWLYYCMDVINKHVIMSVRWNVNIICLIKFFIYIYASEGLLYDAISSISTSYTLGGLGFCTLVGPMVAASQQKIFEPNQINPYYITGFTDAEGCFLINVRPNSKMKIGYSVELVFKIALHPKDKSLVENLRNYFKVGTVSTRGLDCIQYWVGSFKDLQVIVHHFDNYPLITQKWSDHRLLKQPMDLMKGKEHLTKEGLQKIVSIKARRLAVLNNGLSNELKIAFPDTVSAIRPQINNQTIPDPHWMSGFVDGEGCYYIAVNPSSSRSEGRWNSTIKIFSWTTF